MSLILLILLTLILIIFLTIIIILYIGFSVSTRLKVESLETTGELDFKWLNFTLYHMDFPKEDEEIKKEKKSSKKEDEEETKKTLSEKLEDFLYLLKCKINPLIPYIKEALGPFFEFLVNGSKTFNLKLLYLKFLIGFEETSATTLSVGYIWAFASILNIAPMVDISAIPDFENEIMDMYGELIIEIYPLKAIKAAIKLLTKKSVLRLIFEVIKVII